MYRTLSLNNVQFYMHLDYVKGLGYTLSSNCIQNHTLLSDNVGLLYTILNSLNNNIKFETFHQFNCHLDLIDLTLMNLHSNKSSIRLFGIFRLEMLFWNLCVFVISNKYVYYTSTIVKDSSDNSKTLPRKMLRVWHCWHYMCDTTKNLFYSLPRITLY